MSGRGSRWCPKTDRCPLALVSPPAVEAAAVARADADH